MKDRSFATPLPITSRRSFLRRTGGGAAAAFAAPALLTRLAVGAIPELAPSASTDSNTDPLFMSATKLAGLIRTRKISSVEAVQLCLRRIDDVNPKLHAVVAQCRDRALDEARSADAVLASGRPTSALHGVPMTITDSLDTAGVVSTGGTSGRRDFIPTQDATVVARLRAAGAILLGKSNTSEFSLGGNRVTANAVFGRTRNPYGVAFSPGGPSGGAGAIVAAGGSSFDLGSGLEGSGCGPAFANGISGLKPTFGLCPRTGHVVGGGGPLDAFLTIGPLARRVEDLPLLLRLMAGPDALDPMIAPVPLSSPSGVDLGTLRVVFYTRGSSNSSGNAAALSPEISTLVQQCVHYFADLGCRVTEDRPPKLTELSEMHRLIGRATGGDHLRRLLVKHGTSDYSPWLETTGTEIPSPEFTKAIEELDAIKSEQLAWFENHDLVICPGGHTAEMVHWDSESPAPGSRAAGEKGGEMDVADLNGWPAGVVRAGTSREVPGLPLGIQVMSHPWRDDRVLAALAHIESRTGGWQQPSL